MAAGAVSAGGTGIEITVRHPPFATDLLCLIGPGASGKTTLGSALAPLLGRALVDLDEAFTGRIGDIGAYVRDEGYAAYKQANSRIAQQVLGKVDGPTLFVASSGFLTPDNPPDALARNRSLLAMGYSLCLLPSLDIDEAARIIVARQLSRSYARDAAREEAVIRDRFPLYRELGDMLVSSHAAPTLVARALAERLAPLDPATLRR